MVDLELCYMSAVEEVRLEFPPLHEAYTAVLVASCGAAIGDRLGEWRDSLDRGPVRLTEIGLELKASDCVRARNKWDHLQENASSRFPAVRPPPDANPPVAAFPRRDRLAPGDKWAKSPSPGPF